MKKSLLQIISFLILIAAGLAACTTDSGFQIPEPTFEGVKENKMFSIEGLEPEPVRDGIVKYIVEEGRGVDKVVIRDNISFFITLTTVDGEIIYSSYQNGSESPDQRSVQGITPPQFVQNYNLNLALTNGLRKGIIGMREGEKRVLIVPPSEGFVNVNSRSFNAPFQNDTLRYDIELNRIL